MDRVLALVFLLAAGCAATGTTHAASTSSAGEETDDARTLYEEAYLEFRDDNCIDAEPKFRRLRREFPYSRYAALADLRVGDCQIQSKAYTEAISTFQTFVRYRASHPLVSYARYRIAESHYKQIPSDWFLAPPSYERDLDEARDALRHLRKFILDYPEDENVPNASQMAQRALDILARHELYVAEFYDFRDDATAVVLRIERLLYAYQGSSVEAEALELLASAYAELHRDADADAARQRARALRSDTPED